LIDLGVIEIRRRLPIRQDGNESNLDEFSGLRNERLATLEKAAARPEHSIAAASGQNAQAGRGRHANEAHDSTPG
jgi:hypothetical protein